MLNKIGFVGLGLIGGSLAKAFRRYNLTKDIVAYDVDTKTLQLAKEEGIITQIASSIDRNFKDCDIIFLCCPVSINLQAVKKLIPIISSDCILTDVGSTKEMIVHEINSTYKSCNFIGGHPMTGSEKSGYVSSSTQLFENAYYILTPSDSTKQDHLTSLENLLIAINAIPIIMKSDTHDYATAMISHVPHVLASSLVNVVKEEDKSNGFMHTLAAGGFKDITRIASSSPEMWQHICLSNKDNIVKILDHIKADLSTIQGYILTDNKEALFQMFNTSKNYRDSFEDKSFGNIINHYRITIDVEDRPGIIMRVAKILSENNINIKNIGIINNREHDQGVLEIIFYDKESINKSSHILEELGYTIYKN